jgi:hypothetical protein
MRSKWFAPPILVVALFAAAVTASAQVVPAYKAPGIPLTIGGGGSNYDVDWGHGRMWGETVWADYYPGFFTSHVHGLGVELEGRDISIGRNLPAQKNIRQDTIEFGGIYSWHHFRNFHPYAKMLVGIGSYDFTTTNPKYSHDTRALMAGAGGFDYHVWGPFWARADYEYQVWQLLLGNYPDPQGFTAGIAYDFGRPRDR